MRSWKNEEKKAGKGKVLVKRVQKREVWVQTGKKEKKKRMKNKKKNTARGAEMRT